MHAHGAAEGHVHFQEQRIIQHGWMQAGWQDFLKSETGNVQ